MKTASNFILILAMLLVSGLHSGPASAQTGVSDWDAELRQSLESVDAVDSASRASQASAPKPVPVVQSAPVRPANMPPDVPEVRTPLEDLDVDQAKARIDNLERRLSRMERSLRTIENRQRSIDRAVDDIKRRR